MPEYLISGTNLKGKKETRRLDVASADEAVAVLKREGYDEIVLHTDDVGALYTQHSQVEEAFTPRQFLLFRDLPAPLAGFLLVTFKIYQQAWKGCLVLLVVLGLRRWSGRPWGWFDGLFVAFLLLPAIWALIAQFFRGAAGEYNRLLQASSWGRWEEALHLSERGIRGVPPEELAFRRAAALAGLGRFDEAMEAVEPFGDGRAMPEWLYRSRLGDVYYAAKRPEKGIAEAEAALELAPGNATLLLELARVEIWYRHNPRRAREYLARAREHALDDVTQVFATYIEGMICLEEGHPHDALPLLDDAYRRAHAFRHASPLMGGLLDLMHSVLALAHVSAGDMEAGLRHYRLAEPRLRALRLAERIELCEEALGLPRQKLAPDLLD